MNVGIRNEASQFHFWEYMFPSFGTVPLQCPVRYCTSALDFGDSRYFLGFEYFALMHVVESQGTKILYSAIYQITYYLERHAG